MKNKLRVERAIHKISQQQLADKIGVSRQTVNAIELDKYIPSAVIVMKIAKLFEKPVEELFELEEKD